LAYSGLDAIYRATLGVVVPVAWLTQVNDDVAFVYGDTTWTAPSSYTNGWTGGASIGFRREGNEVWMRGQLIPGTANTTAFTLPVGYRPPVASTHTTGMVGTTLTNLVAIGTGGTVTPLTSSGTVILDGLRFALI